MTSKSLGSSGRMAEAFLEQNPNFAQGLTNSDLMNVALFAEYHSGNLIVLSRYLNGTMWVKAHDSWGDEDNPVVHMYDASDPDGFYMVAECDNGHEAIRTFLHLDYRETPVEAVE